MRSAHIIIVAAVVVFGCVGPEDTPSSVRDLRVLGIQTEPPELFAPRSAQATGDEFAICDPLDAAPVYVQPVKVTALIADPEGAGRALEYTLTACAWPGDRTCESADDRIELTSGTTPPGELSTTQVLGARTLPRRDNQLLLVQVYEQDIYKGFGGLRMPLVFRISGGEEIIYAQKLMLFGCEFFPGMTANVNPVLPGLLLNGEPWNESDKPLLEGRRSHRIEPVDFSALEESYVVPTFELGKVALKESWKIAWYADEGRFSPEETGGTDLGGEESRHAVEWSPSSKSQEQDVNFWIVVRDGRGGQSWLRRTAHFKP